MQDKEQPGKAKEKGSQRITVQSSLTPGHPARVHLPSGCLSSQPCPQQPCCYLKLRENKHFGAFLGSGDVIGTWESQTDRDTNHSRWQARLGHLGQSHTWKTFHSQKDCWNNFQWFINSLKHTFSSRAMLDCLVFFFLFHLGSADDLSGDKMSCWSKSVALLFLLSWFLRSLVMQKSNSDLDWTKGKVRKRMRKNQRRE